MQKSPWIRKSLVWIWVALCVGFAAGHLLSKADRAQERAVVDRMRKEFDALKAETTAAAAAVNQVASLKLELATTQDALAAALETKPADGTDAGQGEPPPDDPKRAFSDMVLRIGHAQVKGQIEGRLGVLRDRLQLGAAQEAAVKKILDDEAAAASAALDRLMSGQGTPADFGRLSRLQRGQLPDGIEASLTDAQKAEYTAFKEQERESSVENRVNMELSGLAAAGGLTPEQKDEAFSTLTGVLLAEDATDFETMQDTSEVRAFVDEATQRRLDTMQPILTESQLQMYRQQVEMGRQFISNLMPAETP